MIPSKGESVFINRHDAGSQLAKALLKYKNTRDTLVLGLARGGVVVAAEIARSLSLPLNATTPRKIGAPDNPELAIGAIMDTGESVFNDSIIHMMQISKNDLQVAIAKEKKKALERIQLYRQHAPLPPLKNMTVILVDDGIATGATMLATIKAMRAAQVSKVVVATPLCAASAFQAIKNAADELIALYTEDIGSISAYYEDFAQVDDATVIDLLQNKSSFSQDIRIPLGTTFLEGTLTLPENAQGLVIFAHGSGSSRFSPRNQFVAHFLNQHQLGTLLIDLLTKKEDAIDEVTSQYRFDIALLAERLMQTTDYLLQHPQTQALPLSYFGASTGAAAALIAAAKKGQKISSVVSRGGRPDLALSFLPQVRSPVLLIVGGNDLAVIDMNQKAYDMLSCTKKLEIVPNATHLFEEPGALATVAHLACDWMLRQIKTREKSSF